VTRAGGSLAGTADSTQGESESVLPAATPAIEDRPMTGSHHAWTRATLTGVTKRFGAITALDGVDLELRSGTVHGVIGQNGAGKSTLIKVLSGLVKPDSGSLDVDGTRTPFGRTDPRGGWAVSTAFQELTFIPHLSIAENLLLGRERAHRVHSFEATVRAAAQILQRWEVSDIDPRRPIKNAPLPVRQRVEIVRALERATQLLILDEPTSALDPAGTEWLKARIRAQRARGCGVIIVSHRLAEIADVCDFVTVLRDGKAVASEPRADLDAGQITTLMLGRELEQQQKELAERHAVDERGTAAVLEARDLAAPPVLRGVDMVVRTGEIVGVAALEGQGQRELFMALFGAARPARGSVVLDGRPVRFRSPRSAIAKGLGLVPEDRKAEGLLLSRSVRENLALPALRRASKGGIVAARRERKYVRPAMQSLGLSPRVLDANAASLSGGNQQKAVAAKWLYATTRMLLMYDPLRGVDVGARQEFFSWMTQFASQGGAMLFYSSDIDELTTVCDRVITLYRGRVTSTLTGREVTREQVLRNMLGEGSDDGLD
jgi:ribose transport system ATP-binding protein